jgi:hypothetical protein
MCEFLLREGGSSSRIVCFKCDPHKYRKNLNSHWLNVAKFYHG